MTKKQKMQRELQDWFEEEQAESISREMDRESIFCEMERVYTTLKFYSRFVDYGYSQSKMAEANSIVDSCKARLVELKNQLN